MQIQKTTYKKLIEDNPSLKEYNLAYAADWSVLSESIKYFSVVDPKSKNLKGSFMLYYSKRIGMTHVSNVPFFQDIALWVRDEFDSVYKQNSLVKNVLRFVSKFLASQKWVNISVPYQIADMQPFLWNGLNVSPRYTYLLYISKTKEELVKNFGRGLKQSVKKIEEGEFTYSNKLDLDVKDLIANSSLINRSEDEKQFFFKFIDKLSQLESTKVLKVRDGAAESTALFVRYGAKAVYLFGGSKNASGSTVGTASVYKSLEILKKENVEILDFEGSMIPGVEKFFRTFGGELVPLFNIKKEPKFLRFKKLFTK